MRSLYFASILGLIFTVSGALADPLISVPLESAELVVSKIKAGDVVIGSHEIFRVNSVWLEKTRQPPGYSVFVKRDIIIYVEGSDASKASCFANEYQSEEIDPEERGLDLLELDELYLPTEDPAKFIRAGYLIKDGKDKPSVKLLKKEEITRIKYCLHELGGTFKKR